MPIYVYKCSICGVKRELVQRIADLDKEPVYCSHDGFVMNRVIQAPMVFGDYEAYDCPITGKRIEGRRAHEENLKRHGCRVLEPGETNQAVRFRQQQEAALDRSIEETADRFITGLPTEKRDRLAAEMEHGLDASIVRQAPQGD